MPTFAAVKIHYDHRQALPAHLKYSTLPSLAEYNEYLALFRDQDIGGNGFHECLNFAIPEVEPVRFYLPPTCIPASSRIDDEFVIFSFTYKGDQSLSAHVVGVHAGARLLSAEAGGLPRDHHNRIEGVEPLQYHAEAPGDLVTLFNPPLPYTSSEGLYTPKYKIWGYGLRYIEEQHASRIISSSLTAARMALPDATTSQAIMIQRQIDVLLRIAARYQIEVAPPEQPGRRPPAPPREQLPDAEVGYAGERLVYEREIAYVRSINREPNEVEWVSQAAPTSPYDIKTIRLLPGGDFREHYIEVKSSAADDTNVYVSSGQMQFLHDHADQSTVALVRFSNTRPPTVRELTLPQLQAEFDLVPIKFKLAARA